MEEIPVRMALRHGTKVAQLQQGRPCVLQSCHRVVMPAIRPPPFAKAPLIILGKTIIPLREPGRRRRFD